MFGGLGLGAFWQRHRQKAATDTWQGELGRDPAEGLRAKLAEGKTPTGDTPAEPEPAPAGEKELSPLDPELRRRNVHERARASLDELK